MEAPKDADLRYVVDHMRAKDAAEFAAVNPVNPGPALADLLFERYSGRKDTYCASDERPVAVGAMVEGRPNVATLMFLATDEFPKIATPLTRFIVQTLFPLYRREGVHRIECVSMDGYTDAHRWIEALGLEHEATLHGFGKNGETFHQFAWVAEHVR